MAQLASWFGQVSTDMGPVVSQGQSLAATFGAQVQPILQRVGAWIQTSFMPAWQQLSAQIAAAVAVAVPIIQQFVAGMMERLAPLLPVVQQIFGAIGEIIVSVMGIVGAIVIARWAWTLMGVTAGVLLDQTDAHVAEEIRELVETPGDATITDLHVWQIGPQAHAAIVSVLGEATANADSIRERLKSVHEVSHLTIEFRPV